MADSAFGNHVIMYDKFYSLCEGCGSCKIVCALAHDGVTGPYHGAIKLNLDLTWDHMYQGVYTCQHCLDHPCYDACPKKDEAMCIDENGIVYVNEENCIGCRKCERACSQTPSRIVYDKTNRKVRKCDLCRTRADGPQCIKYCPVRCLGLSDDPLPYDLDRIKADIAAAAV